MLERVFASTRDGFYIDVGAGHHIRHSVTCHFYEKGWHGINVEPEPEYFGLLARYRRRDINLNLALGSREEDRTFYLGDALSTLDIDIADTHVSTGSMQGRRELPVSVTTLGRLCDQYCGATDISFLKIDVEGWESQVICGANWERYRPRVVLVEATFPNSRTPAWDKWEPMLAMNRYRFVYFDGLNRFYVREEDAALEQYFSLPPNAFDQFVLYDTVEARRRLEAVYRTRSWRYTSVLRTFASRLGRALGRRHRPSLSDTADPFPDRALGRSQRPIIPLRRALRCARR